MQIELTIPLIASVTGMILGLASFIISRGKDSKELEARVTALETKIEPFWQFINKELPSIIMQQTTPTLDILLEKSKNEELSDSEANVLLYLLEEEYSKAKLAESAGRAFAIALYRETVKYKRSTRGKKK